MTAIENLEKHISAQHYYGNEPYDGLNTTYNLFKKAKASRLFITHFNKFSVINFRPVLGIDKYQHTKTLAILLSAYCNLFNLTQCEQYREKYYECRNLLLNKELTTGGFGGSYDYQMRNWLASRNALSTLVTILTVIGLIKGYVCFRDKPDLLKARSLLQLIIDKHVLIQSETVHVKYASSQPAPILNVFSMTAGATSLVYSVTQEHYLLDLATLLIKTILRHQFSNGAWPYIAGESYEQTQIDFHQGFILEGIYYYLNATGFKDDGCIEALKKGSDFYWQKLFRHEGASFFRHQKKFPVDICNQSEGILFFSLFSAVNRNALTSAERIAEWTLSKMASEKGYFYYQKWPFIINKIPYMAWGQASMLQALSELALRKQDT